MPRDTFLFGSVVFIVYVCCVDGPRIYVPRETHNFMNRFIVIARAAKYACRTSLFGDNKFVRRGYWYYYYSRLQSGVYLSELNLFM